MKDNNFVVYKHTAPNGKVYIGLTKQKPETRWANGKGYRNNDHFSNAIDKYGWDSFSHEVLKEGLTLEEACEEESRLIKKYCSYDRMFGYNKDFGGGVAEKTETTKKKISKKAKEEWQNPDFRKKAINGMRGKKRSKTARENISVAQKKRFESEEQRYIAGSSFRGKKHTEEQKKKISKSLRDFYSDESNLEALRAKRKEVNKKLFAVKIICIETGKIYESIAEASKELQICRQNISACCRGRRKTCGGFHWEYV